MRRRIQTKSLLFAVACLSGAGNAQSVIATIPVADFVGGGAIDSQAKLAYIPTGNNGTSALVVVVNEKTQTLARTISLSTSWPAVSAALNHKTGLLYVGTESGGLFVVNAKTGATVALVHVNAVSVAANPITSKIYASDFDHNLYVVDGATNTIDAVINIDGIQGIAVDALKNRVYAAVDFNPGDVAVVDGKTNQVIAEPSAAGGLTSGVAVDPFRNIFYSSDTDQLSASGTGTVSIYNGKTNTLTTSVTLQEWPALIVVDPVTFTVYASSPNANAVEVIEGSKDMVTSSVQVGSQPQYMTDDPINKLLYVGCQGPTNANGYPTYVLYVIKTG